MKRRFVFFLGIIIASVFGIGGCTEFNIKENETPQIQIESQTGIINVQEDETSNEVDKVLNEEENTINISVETSNIGEISKDYTEVMVATETTNLRESTQIEIVSESATQSIEISLEKDLTENDIEKLKSYKKIIVHVLKQGIDISFLSKLNDLEDLSIYQREGVPGPLASPASYYISDFSFLNGMNLKTLQLDCGGFDINFNTINLINLETLYIYYADIESEDEIITLPALKELNIRFSQMKSISPLCGLNVETLYLDANGFEQKNCDRINEIKTIKNLYISYCDDIEFTTLSGLINLEELTLRGNEINYNIEIIYELTWLKNLFVIFRFITDEQAKIYREINPECCFVVTDN